MNELEKFFAEKQHRLMHKWSHYFEIYDRHFQQYRGKEINLLEIGISHGGSLEMWDHYFQGKANIFAVDINPECKKFETTNTKIFIGSQQDTFFLNQLKKDIPPIDILIDDGGHTMKQQITTFNLLYDHVKDGGLYLCEDLHTSYWKTYGGGYKKRKSFIEFSKNFIDNLHAWYSRKIKFNEITESVFALHYYDSILVIEKRKIMKPHDIKSGYPSIVDPHSDELLSKKKPDTA
jgi:hypothetical protein